MKEIYEQLLDSMNSSLSRFASLREQADGSDKPTGPLLEQLDDAIGSYGRHLTLLQAAVDGASDLIPPTDPEAGKVRRFSSRGRGRGNGVRKPRARGHRRRGHGGTHKGAALK